MSSLKRVELRRAHVGLGAVVRRGKLVGDRAPEPFARPGRPAASCGGEHHPGQRAAQHERCDRGCDAPAAHRSQPEYLLHVRPHLTLSVRVLARGRASGNLRIPRGARVSRGDPLWQPRQRQALARRSQAAARRRAARKRWACGRRPRLRRGRRLLLRAGGRLLRRGRGRLLRRRRRLRLERADALLERVQAIVELGDALDQPLDAILELAARLERRLRRSRSTRACASASSLSDAS